MIMKKSLIMVMLVMVGAVTFAQSHRRGYEKHGNGQIEKMKTDLALNDTQYAAIKNINEKYAAKQATLKMDSSAHETFKALHQEKDKEIQAVLTPEQKTKWETFKVQRNETRKRKVTERLEGNDARMKSDLSLSDDQFTKMQAANKSFREKVKTLKGQSSGEQLRDNPEFKKLKTDHDAAVKNILTEEQFAKWMSLRSERKNVRHHGRE
jgi:hypothetical protein